MPAFGSSPIVRHWIARSAERSLLYIHAMYRTKCRNCPKTLTRLSYKESVSDDPERQHLIKVNVSYVCHHCGYASDEEYFRTRREKKR